MTVLAAQVSAALKLKPSPLRVQESGRCDCPGEGSTLYRVVLTAEPQQIVWLRGDRETSPDQALYVAEIARRPGRTVLHLARCKACGATWIIGVRLTEAGIEIEAARRESYGRAVVTE